MGNKSAKKKKIIKAANSAKAFSATTSKTEDNTAKSATQKTPVVKANVDDKSVSIDPVVITPPKGKQDDGLNSEVVKKAVEKSEAVVEARRIAKEAKEEARRASLKAEEVINETLKVIEPKNSIEGKVDVNNTEASKNEASQASKSAIPIGHTIYSWRSNDFESIPIGHTKFSFRSS